MESKTVRIQKVIYDRLKDYSIQHRLSRKRTLEIFTGLALNLVERMKGHHLLILDNRLKMKFYFDKDDRTEIEF